MLSTEEGAQARAGCWAQALAVALVSGAILLDDVSSDSSEVTISTVATADASVQISERTFRTALARLWPVRWDDDPEFPNAACWTRRPAHAAAGGAPTSSADHHCPHALEWCIEIRDDPLFGRTALPTLLGTSATSNNLRHDFPDRRWSFSEQHL